MPTFRRASIEALALSGAALLAVVALLVAGNELHEAVAYRDAPRTEVDGQ